MIVLISVPVLLLMLALSILAAYLEHPRIPRPQKPRKPWFKPRSVISQKLYNETHSVKPANVWKLFWIAMTFGVGYALLSAAFQSITQ